MDSNGLTREQLERFESYYFSVNHFSCTHDDARDNGHYRENYWLYDKCCKQENKELKGKLEKCKDVLEFYSEDANWLKQNQTNFTIIHKDDREGNIFLIGGKRARQVLKELGENK